MLTTKHTKMVHEEMADNANNQPNHDDTCRDG